jgi:dolichol-phosphate mannosyltransferase
VRKVISIVSPAFNEAACVDELARRLTNAFEPLADRYDFEAIIVENGSRDETYQKLLAINARDPRFKVIRLSRNFGAEGGAAAGIHAARGDALVIMCADLQDPPEVIPRFIAEWERGYENVYGIITRRHDESAMRRIFTRAFYWLMHKLSETSVPRNASDFRLVDRRVYEALLTFPERNALLRTLWWWMGFKSIGIEHERPPRFGGTSTYRFWLNFGMAIRGLLTNSYLPLKMIPLFGLALSAISFLLMIGSVVRAVTFGVPFDGFGTIVGLMLLLFGFLFMLLGVISEYIGMIFEEVRARPRFIVSETRGFDEETDRATRAMTMPRIVAR